MYLVMEYFEGESLNLIEHSTFTRNFYIFLKSNFYNIYILIVELKIQMLY